MRQIFAVATAPAEAQQGQGHVSVQRGSPAVPAIAATSGTSTTPNAEPIPAFQTSAMAMERAAALATPACAAVWQASMAPPATNVPLATLDIQPVLMTHAIRIRIAWGGLDARKMGLVLAS